MDNREITRNMVRITCDNSCFDSERNYVSLSNCAQTTRELIDQYNKGFQDSTAVRLKCYKGYQMERDLVNRLKMVYGDLISTGTEISIADGLVKGHPDFEFREYPGDCKSVLRDSWIPDFRKLPRRVFWQMQAYMFYMKKNKSLVIYESRETGFLRVYLVFRNARVQA